MRFGETALLAPGGPGLQAGGRACYASVRTTSSLTPPAEADNTADRPWSQRRVWQGDRHSIALEAAGQMLRARLRRCATPPPRLRSSSISRRGMHFA